MSITKVNMMKMFQPIKIGKLEISNRIVRAATYEGMADSNGFVGEKYLKTYETLAKNNVGLIITGFAFISNQGRAMQQHQTGIDNFDKVLSLSKVTNAVHKYDSKIFLQLAHTGRQTIKKVTGERILSSTNKPSVYFRQKPCKASSDEINSIIKQFAHSAYLAKEAGFDGVQIHAAHGYLIHQFLLNSVNTLKNEFGIDKKSGLGTYLLDRIIDSIKQKSGSDYPILIKISGDHDLGGDFYPEKFRNLIKFLNAKDIDAIEISYGTMDYAVNIFRGSVDYNMILKYNPLFKTNVKIMRLVNKFLIRKFLASKLIEFKPFYNLDYAKEAKKITDKPIISVGGFRTKDEIEWALENNFADMVSLSRPFIVEPDFVRKLLKSTGNYVSKCTNCNKCVYMCDSGEPTKCRSFISEKIN